MPEEKLKLLFSIADPDHYDPITQKPYQVTADGKPWEFATNGILLLAFRAEETELAAVPKSRKNSEKAIAGWLASKPSRVISNAREFANFLNLAEYANCPMCSGSGKRGIQAEGEWFNDPLEGTRYVLIGGHIFNANLLAKTLIFLDIAGLETLPVGINGHNDGARLTLYGPDWILTLMSANPETIDSTNLPEWMALEPINQPEVN